MKLLSNFRNHLRKTLNNKRGQGATEYILLLVVVVGLVMMFRKPIQDAISKKTADLSTDMDSIKSQQ